MGEGGTAAAEWAAVAVAGDTRAEEEAVTTGKRGEGIREERAGAGGTLGEGTNRSAGWS